MAIVTANVTSVGTDVYTSNGNSAVTYASFCNYSANAVSANIHVVPNGDSPSNLNLTITGLELTASGNGTGDTYQLYSGGEKLLLENGDLIYVQANTDNAIAAVVSFTSI